MADAPRVALLARPGEACERLRVALREAGGEIVIEADPSTIDPQALRIAAVETVLVALDPAVEDALEKFDDVLADRAIEVIFDEADLAARREGWDAARWVRHLAAKLHRHDDVLPPGREPDSDPLPVPGRPEAPAERHADADIAAFVAEAGDIAAQVPREAEIGSIEFEEPVLAQIAVEAPALELEAAPVATAYSGISFTDDLDALDFEGETATFEMPAPTFREAPQDFDALLRDLGGANDEVAEPAISLDIPVDIALDSSVDMPAMDLSIDVPVELPPAREFTPKEALPSLDFDIAPPTAPAAKEVERAMPSFSNLSLEALTDAPTATARATDAPVAPQFNKNLSQLEDKIASLSLVGAAGVEAKRGAVLILAGIGGPDAVRQILTGLPTGFPRAVLISQRLDGGRYDRLVQQMGRAANLQVRLAEAGATLEAGHVYIVPPELGIDGANGLRFAPGFSLLDALPAEDSAVLLLSGADPSVVDGALAHAARGALVAGQSPDGCYDAAAPVALAVRGGTAAAPQELVQSLLQRWPA